MKKIILFVIVVLIVSCSNEESKNKYYMPGEFEEQEAVWLGWPGL